MDIITPLDYVALFLLMVTFAIGWIAWSLLQNRKLYIDARRVASICIGSIAVVLGWLEFVLLRE